MTYRGDIDGLRALAVLAVILFHFELGCPGGYAGVDVFFVISGFLIGSIVIGKSRSGAFSLTDFWIRRIRRLLPALFVLVLVVAAASWFWMVPAHLEEIGKSILAQPALAANVYFFQESGYFETASEYQPLLHTWSLAVEEQFYLALPFLLPLFLKGGFRGAFLGVGIITILSLAWSILGSVEYQSFAFYMILSRAWELNIGVLLALHIAKNGPPRLGRSAREALGWLGLFMIVACFVLYGRDTPFPSYTALLPCLGTALLILAHTRADEPSPARTSLDRFLSWKPVIFTGWISYSLYLWHWPVFVFSSHVTLRDLTTSDKILGIAASFVLASLSWRFLEQPVRKRTALPGTKSLLAATAAAVAVMVGIGLYFSENDGLPERFPPEVLEITRDPSDHHGIRARDQLLETGELPIVGAPSATAEHHLLLWGDSHAISLLPVLDDLGRETGTAVHVAAHPSTPPLVDVYTPRIGKSHLDWGDSILAYARERNIRHVLLHARWRIYTEGPPDGDMRSLLSDEGRRSRTPSQATVVFRDALKRTLRALEEEGFETITLMDDVPFQPRSVPETVLLAASRGIPPNDLGPTLESQQRLTRSIDQLIGEVVSEFPANRIDPDPVLLKPDGERFSLVRDGKILYSDQHHLSPNGTRQLRPLLAPLFSFEKNDRE